MPTIAGPTSSPGSSGDAGRPAAADQGHERAAAAQSDPPARRRARVPTWPASPGCPSRPSRWRSPTSSAPAWSGAGQRTGVPGRSALLYEIRPDAGFVLGLDIGRAYLRGAVADLTGRPGPRGRTRRPSVRGRVTELIALADGLCAAAGSPGRVTQTVLGSPGVYDPRRNADHAGRRAGRLGHARSPGRPARGVRRERWRSRTTPTLRRSPSGRTVTAGSSRASFSSPSAPASAWAWCSTAGCIGARTEWPGRSRSCRFPRVRSGHGRRRGAQAGHHGGRRLGVSHREGRPQGRHAHAVRAPCLRGRGTG